MPRIAFAPVDRMYISLIVGLSIFGLIVLLSASGPLSFQYYSDPLYFLRRQIVLGLIPGTVLFILFSRIPYRTFFPYVFPALVVSCVLLLSVFIPGVGHTVGGSTSWLNFGFFKIQPSEFVKVTFLIYAAGWLASKAQKEGKTLAGSLPLLASLGIVILLLMLQPDTGTMSVIVFTSVLTYFVAGAPIVWFVAIGTAIASIIGVLIAVTPYRAARFLTFLHPELDPQGIGYHINQALLAIGSGGFFGLGYGQSRQKYLYLPEVQGDSIFAIMGEEFGFIFTVLFIAAIGCIVWRCFVIAREAPDAFGTYLAVGVGSWIAVQTAVNIASMTGLLPMTGVTLPFVSYGNSATVSLFIALGIVASISRERRERIPQSI